MTTVNQVHSLRLQVSVKQKESRAQEEEKREEWINLWAEKQTEKKRSNFYGKKIQNTNYPTREKKRETRKKPKEKCKQIGSFMQIGLKQKPTEKQHTYTHTHIQTIPTE